ncbi:MULTISPECIES: FimV family protein [unclassified Janthinobacterium]|uniref:type IV pilus assembly protein FimV n=1 Tax=unclassified Janthinobacterium TaxID=2610881 RepID=UPI00161339C0|nr:MULTISPECIES: hypothetical protein [unclassified Janthinobacterium]MBB5369576.1 hypothetical protein [Janthinobacterium sp. K2C7]MBB5382468.1 hypothetical protein [Janthinobacterium sp. K2Li3]MBB5388045.1 hypothetical protein [Janthinobacterium sp. K2E3]
MQSSVFSRRILISCAAASVAMPGAFAAELGDISALSHVGQPLSADIELTALAPDESAGVAVRLASPDVYQGGGITMDPALQGLAISQAVRHGRRYVHVSTQQAITAGHVHLYFVLGSGSGANVRLATVWLTPAPAAPVPAPVPLAVLAALPAKPLAPPPDAAALAARVRAEGMVRPPAVFVPPAVPLMRPPLRRTIPAAASCAPQAVAAPDASCVALNQQNAALNDKLGELEGKVGALQKALAVPAVAPAVAAAPAAAEAPHAKPKPLHAAPAVKEKKPSGGGLWWLGLGILLFLLLTAVIVYVWRKRREKGADRPPSKYWVLLRKPFRRAPVPVLTETVEEGEAEAAPAEPEPSPFSR